MTTLQSRRNPRYYLLCSIIFRKNVIFVGTLAFKVQIDFSGIDLVPRNNMHRRNHDQASTNFES